ncbi:MAG: hypothetical protein AAB606_02825 [Patescibacteria group bacterium]
MADEQKPPQPIPGGQPKNDKTSGEADASDLLSLWGVGSAPIAKPTPTPVPTPSPAPKPELAPAPIPAPQPSPTFPKPQPEVKDPIIAPKPVTAPTPAPTPAASGPPPPPPKPIEQKPIEKPIEAKPIFESKPTLVKPVEARPIEPKPVQAKPIEPKPTEAKIFEPKPEKKLEPEPEPKFEPKKEVLEGELVSIPEAESGQNDLETLEEEPGLASQFEDFLRELNLTPGSIFKFVGCIILLVALGIGGFYGYKYYTNRTSSQIAPQQNKPEISNEGTGITTTEKLGSVEEINISAITDTGIASVIAIGQESPETTTLGSYIMTFKRLQNEYGTKVNELLNKATDRRGALQSHLAVLRKLYNDGIDAGQAIQKEIDVIKVQYTPQAKEQEISDANFFEQLNALNPQTSQDLLNGFIRTSRETVALRARFKALQKVQSFYDRGLPKMGARIRDIELNFEPLVTGMKVYDVSGSDLQLIVPVEFGDVPREKLSGTTGYSFLPVTEGADYITQPGGGFQDQFATPK